MLAPHRLHLGVNPWAFTNVVPVRTCRHRGTAARSTAPSHENAEQLDVDLLETKLRVSRQRLSTLVAQEDYRAASQVQRLVQELEDAHPVLRLEKQLKQAVSEERYQDAAQLQEQLREAQQRTGQMGDLTPDSELRSSSEAITHGIRVCVRSVFLPMHSRPSRNEFLFAYQVSISNQSAKVVQLRTRHWIIKDANGKKEEVRGPGVVGNSPVLLPGKSYEYQSGCPLTTPWGTMEGSYQFVVLDETDGRFKDVMDVRVAKFKLQSAADGNQ